MAAPLTLKEVVKLSVNNSEELKEARLKVDKANLDLLRAESISNPTVDLTMFAAPMYETTGNTQSSKDNYSKWGVFTGGEITIIQPLFSWGIKQNYVDAAKRGKSAAEFESTSNRNRILKRVISYYYNHLLSQKMLDLASSTYRKLDKVEEVLKKKRNKRDLLKVQLRRNLINEKLAEAKLANDLTKKAISFYTKLESLVIEQTIKPIPTLSSELSFYLSKAKESNFDLKRLEAGLEAREKLISAEKKKKYPNFFVGAKGDYKYSNVKDDQNSVFANDPYNSTSGGVFLGMRMDLNFQEISYREKKAIHEHKALLIKQSYAKRGTELKVQKAFSEFLNLQNLVKSTKKSMKLAKRLLVKESIRHDIQKKYGKDVIDALLEKVLAIKNYYSAVTNFNNKYIDLLDLCGYDLSQLTLYKEEVDEE